MNEEMNKALRYFGREDLTDGLYENNIDDNVQVFLTIRQMIKFNNLQSKIDKAYDYLDKFIPNEYGVLLTERQWNYAKSILKEVEKNE